MVLLQETKFKLYYNTLLHSLKEYRRVVQMVRPISSNLLKPHLDNLEFSLRPGMVSLTWTSMNIDVYIQQVWTELSKLEQLVRSVNDVMETRVDGNLKQVHPLHAFEWVRILLASCRRGASHGHLGRSSFRSVCGKILLRFLGSWRGQSGALD